MRICIQCEKELPDGNKGYSTEYATPLTGGAQSSLIYFAQLLFYNQYQLKKSVNKSDFQLAMNLGLLQSSATLFEALLDQLLVMGMQFRFMSEDWCADCGQKKLVDVASITDSSSLNCSNELRVELIFSILCKRVWHLVFY